MAIKLPTVDTRVQLLYAVVVTVQLGCIELCTADSSAFIEKVSDNNTYVHTYINIHF